MTVTGQNIGTSREPWIAGDTRILEVLVRDAAGVEIDLDTLDIAAARFTLGLPGATPLVDKTLATGIVKNTTTNRMVVTFAAADTISIGTGRYRIELELTFTDATVTTVLTGEAIIRADYA